MTPAFVGYEHCSAIDFGDTGWRYMAEREHDRMPYSVEVDFRTASSFLVAYSVNLSRGGLFLETDADIPTGALLTVDLQIPNAGVVPVNGVVAWRRGADSA